MRMMKMILLGVIALPLLASAQVDLNKAPWKNLPCENGQTQLEMNMCSGKKASIADSVMHILYNKIRNSLEIDLKEELKNSAPDQYELELIKSIRNRINLLKKSQEQFEAYMESMQSFVSDQYSGGSIRPLMVNLWRLTLTEDRVKVLNSLIEELRME